MDRKESNRQRRNKKIKSIAFKKKWEVEARRKALEHLIEGYRIAAENSSEIILDYNVRDDTVCHMNKRALEIYGVSENPISVHDYLTHHGIVLPTYRDTVAELFKKIRNGIKKVTCTIQTQTLSGKIVWNKLTFTSIFNDRHEPVRSIGLLKDITDQQEWELQQEKDLSLRKEMKKDALIAYVADLTNHKILSGFDQVFQSLGVPYMERYEDCMRVMISNLIHPQDRSNLYTVFSVKNLLAQHAQGRDKLEVEYRRLTETKTDWVRGTLLLSDDRREKVVKAFYYVHSIEQIRQEEFNLEDQEILSKIGLYQKVYKSKPSDPPLIKENGIDSNDKKGTGEKDEHRLLRQFISDVPLFCALSKSAESYFYLCDIKKDLFYFPKEIVDEFNLPGQVLENAMFLWSTYIHANERKDFLQDIYDLASGKSKYHNQEYRVRNKDGKWIWLRSQGSVTYDEEGCPALFVGSITNLERKNKIDYLSGLFNKYEFEHQTRFRLKYHEPVNQGGLLLLGLDNFKNINKLYGWEFGDHVVREAAQKIQGLMPENMRVYRLDGDKFGIFFTGLEEVAEEEIYQIIYSAFQQRQEYNGHRYYCTVSAGFACVEAEKSFAVLLKEAEYALEYSKAEGKNRLSRYDVEIMGKKERTLVLIERLCECVDGGFKNFQVYFQPQVEAKTRRIQGAEALLRWSCSEYGSVSPAEFIPILEQTGLIHAVGKWVLLQVADTCRDWRRIHPELTININISFAQLQDKEFVPYLTSLVKLGRLDPRGIHLELTESCIATGSRSLSYEFERLRALGFCIEMDDFGTGYSSLEILKNAPADVVKIDHAFVKDITRSDFDAVFITFVVSLCHSVGIKVCLEGVETWEEYHKVEPMGLDLIQGFLFGRPQPRKSFERMYLR